MVKAAEYTFTIRNVEVNIHNRLSFTALANMLQECASRHASELGVSSLDLMDSGKTWVLSKLKIELNGAPGLEDRLTIRTWPEGGDGVRAFRGFKIFGEKDELLGTAASVWLIIDIKKRRVVTLPSSIPDLRAGEEHVTYDFEKNIPPVETPTFSYETRAGWHDLDINRHVNNNHFIKWIIESFPYDYLQKHRMTGLDMIFKGECFMNDEIAALTRALDTHVFLHQLLKQDGSDLVRAVSRWQKFH